MTINRALHSKVDVDRLYISKNSGSRGMVSVEESVRIEECSLSDYIKRTDTNGEPLFGSFVKDKDTA